MTDTKNTESDSTQSIAEELYNDNLTLDELESVFVILQSVLANIIYHHYHPTKMEEFVQIQKLVARVGEIIARKTVLDPGNPEDK